MDQEDKSPLGNPLRFAVHADPSSHTLVSLSQGFMWINVSNVEIGLQGKGRIIYWFCFSTVRLLLLQSCSAKLVGL